MKLYVDSSWVLLGLSLFLCIGFVNSYYMDHGNLEGRGSKHSVSYNYDRIGEVKKACANVLKSGAELKPDDGRLFTIRDELSFLNGDWWQELNGGGGAPLMPFDGRELSDNSTDLRSPANLVSFWVTDVDRRRHSKNSILVSGILQMGITLEGLLSEKPYEGSPRFDIWPAHSQLSIIFQGVYTESEKKDQGERVMCLLGNAVLPSRQPDLDDPWGWVKESGYTNQPLLSQDDQILLVLRYPKTMTLRSRAVHGSLKSLNPKSNLKYFDEVHISSWLSSSANYQFSSENLVSKACDPYPYKDSLVSGDIDVYKGLDFCDILERFTHQEALTILPNWKCSGGDGFCSRLGPFVSDNEIVATNGSFKNVKLVLQDVHCENVTSKEKGSSTTRVSSVFRAVPPSENRFTAAARTGVSNKTLYAEGIWKSSSGQLCMVGCSATVDADGNGCNTRVCLYVPISFSIKQRSILLGTMSSIDPSQLYFPLAFEKLARPAELWDQFTASHPYYKYSKIVSAGVVLERDEPFTIGAVIKKSLLKFPKLEDMGDFHYSLSLLAEDLTLHITAVPDPFPNSFLSRADLEMEILSLGPLFGRYWPAQYASNFLIPYSSKDELTEKQLLLNVSGQLNLVGNRYSNFSSLFVEGIYDQRVGKMYLIGCRDVRASWQTLYESMDLESGLDCSVEVVVSYPPTTVRWLASPTARVSITSQRNEDDPLYSPPVKLQTVPIMYRRQREEIISRRGVEGVLRISTLSVAITCILSQLFYMRDSMESAPYISLVMLGVQALGYSFPLITGAEALLRKTSTELRESQSSDLHSSQWLNAIDYTVKLLVLAAFSLTLRLCQKVWKSRTRMQTRAPLEPHRVPSDKRVALTTLILHTLGYMVALAVHYMNTSYKPLQTAEFVDSTGNSHVIREWETELEEYLGLVQDFFLLPQVIGNLMWRIHDHVQPLRKVYYIGMTSVRLLPHVYDYISSPVTNPYFSQEYELVNPAMDFYSKVGDIAIPAVAVALAVAVYVQQRWSYEKLRETLAFGRGKFVASGSKVYERLPSVLPEAELSSGVNRNSRPEIEIEIEIEN